MCWTSTAAPPSLRATIVTTPRDRDFQCYCYDNPFRVCWTSKAAPPSLRATIVTTPRDRDFQCYCFDVSFRVHLAKSIEWSVSQTPHARENICKEVGARGAGAAGAAGAPTHDEPRAAHAVVEHGVDELEHDVEEVVGGDGPHDADDARDGEGGDEDGLAAEPVREVPRERQAEHTPEVVHRAHHGQLPVPAGGARSQVPLQQSGRAERRAVEKITSALVFEPRTLRLEIQSAFPVSSLETKVW